MTKFWLKHFPRPNLLVLLNYTKRLCSSKDSHLIIVLQFICHSQHQNEFICCKPIISSHWYAIQALHGIEPLTLLVLVPLSNITPQSKGEQRAEYDPQVAEGSHHTVREEGLYLSCAEAILFTYVKDTIWRTVNLQRPAEPHLAALQIPNSQVQGWRPSIRGKVTWFVYKGGGGRSSPEVPPPPLAWEEAAKISLSLSGAFRSKFKPSVSSPGWAEGWTVLDSYNATGFKRITEATAHAGERYS